MKKKIFIAVFLFFCLTLSGCSVDVVGSVDSLMRPPKLNGESSYLQKAFEDNVGTSKSIIMKTPMSGDNRSSYLLFDIDNDNSQEAIVFYSDPAVDEFAYAGFFKQVDSDWVSIASIKGRGDEIYEVDFADINGDKKYEIIISWTSLLKSEDDVLNAIGGNKRISTVYSYDGSSVKLIHSQPFTKMIFDDFNNDKSDELFFVNIDFSNQKKKTLGQIIVFNKDFSILQNKTFTMSSFIDVFNIVTDTVLDNENSHTRIYVDGAISESGVITEIIDIKHFPFEISLPLYESNISDTPLTLRDARTFSKDIDNDGIVEIPTSESLPGGIRVTEDSDEHSPVYLTVWSEFKDGQMLLKNKCILNNTYNYMFIFNENWIGKFTAVYNVKNATLTFYELDYNSTLGNEIFTLKAFPELKWKENNFGYIKFAENGAFVYGYIIQEDYKQMIDREEITESFVSI